MIIAIQPINDELLVRTLSSCANDEDIYRLECAKCKRLLYTSPCIQNPSIPKKRLPQICMR